MTEKMQCELPDGLTSTQLLESLAEAETRLIQYHREVTVLTAERPARHERAEHSQRVYQAAYNRAASAFASAMLMKALAAHMLLNEKPYADA